MTEPIKQNNTGSALRPQKERRLLPRYRIAAHAGYPLAPFAVCVTRKALNQLLRTVGAYPPETGAKIFCPADLMGIETVEFDLQGSELAGGSVYSPDTRWGQERMHYHLHQPEMRLWSGDVHSHPGGLGRPSGKHGHALGDLGYVEEVFEQNETMEYFLIPILTNTGTGEVVFNPWVCRRGRPVQLMTARLKIYPNTRYFPKRVFNPEWLKSLETAPQAKTTNSGTSALPLDVAEEPVSVQVEAVPINKQTNAQSFSCLY